MDWRVVSGGGVSAIVDAPTGSTGAPGVRRGPRPGMGGGRPAVAAGCAAGCGCGAGGAGSGGGTGARRAASLRVASR